jgi:hypothetical protein
VLQRVRVDEHAAGREELLGLARRGPKGAVRRLRARADGAQRAVLLRGPLLGVVDVEVLLGAVERGVRRPV